MASLEEGLLALLSSNVKPGERETGLAALLEFNPRPVESKILSDNPEIYPGLEEGALSTPFKDYHSILLDAGDKTLVDLGAGYAKGTILSEALNLPGQCLSLELSEERVNYAKSLLRSLGRESGDILRFDLLREDVPLAPTYYFYLPLGALVFKPLQRLLEAGHECELYVSESHGDLLDFFESAPAWFTSYGVLKSEAKRHRSGIYKFRFSPRQVPPSDLNGPEFIYFFVQNFLSNPEVELEKEDGRLKLPLQSLMPIKYNGKMCFECKAVKRIVDYKNVNILDVKTSES